MRGVTTRREAAALTKEDLTILATEGCLVDAEVAAKAWVNHAGGDADQWWDDYADWQRKLFCADAAGALRSQGLTPGQPSVDRLLAAIARRGWGWGYLLGMAASPDRQAGAKVYPGGACPGVATDDPPACALALAFVAAMWAGEEQL